MATNHISGALEVTGAVTAASITAPVTGAVTGDVTGNITGKVTAPAATAYASDGAVGVAVGVANLSKSSAGAYTLAAPGAYGISLRIFASTAHAHVVTVTGLDGGNTLTFGGAAGDNCVLWARSATAWTIENLRNVTVSTV